MVRKRFGTGFYILFSTVLFLALIVYMKYQHKPFKAEDKIFKSIQIDEDIMREKRSKDDDNSECCNGVLGYASNQAQMPVTCPDMKCCNQSETVAVVPIEDAFGFRFRCLPKTRIRPVCYQPGTEVRSSNQDADHIPRACCEGAKFEIELNKWYAAMSVKCVLR